MGTQKISLFDKSPKQGKVKVDGDLSNICGTTITGEGILSYVKNSNDNQR